jgi:hypothetical protein
MRRYAVCFLMFGMALRPVAAHHSIAAEYDERKPVTLKGIVTQFDWSNPHVYIFLDVEGAGGQITPWAAELAPTLDLRRAGWTRDALKPGDSISVEGAPARDGSKKISGSSVVLAGGRKLPQHQSRRSRRGCNPRTLCHAGLMVTCAWGRRPVKRDTGPIQAPADCMKPPQATSA